MVIMSVLLLFIGAGAPLVTLPLRSPPTHPVHTHLVAECSVQESVLTPPLLPMLLIGLLQQPPMNKAAQNMCVCNGNESPKGFRSPLLTPAVLQACQLGRLRFSRAWVGLGTRATPTALGPGRTSSSGTGATAAAWMSSRTASSAWSLHCSAIRCAPATAAHAPNACSSRCLRLTD